MSTNSLDSEIIKLIVAMFNAAPGADALAELRSALAAGESVESLARNLVRTDVFRSLYPDALSSTQFAAQFAQNVLGNEVGFDQLAYATFELDALQLAGLDRGQVVLRAIEALLAVEPANPEWGNARKAFENKIAVAEYYSIDKEKSAQTLEELQKVLAPVTSSATSTQSAIRVIDGLPPLSEPGTPTTPVTPTPEPTPVLGITGLASSSVNENLPFSATPAAVNASGAVRWTLEGTDAALFSIDEDTGALAMVARDFEAPVDADADNRYSITLRVTDAAGNTATQPLTITVADVLEAATLVISGLDNIVIDENLAFAAVPSVTGGIGAVTWSLEGADAGRFMIDSASGALRMVARNFEAPVDADGDNVYAITVKATDADSNSTTQAITVTVNDVQEVSTLTLGNIDHVTIDENTAFNATPTLTGAIGAVTWSLEGADATLFSIDTDTGALSMVARNFEAPEDADGDNRYDITLKAEDADLNSITQSITVTIADVREPVSLILSNVDDAEVAENTAFSLSPGVSTGIGAITWSLEGPDADRFSIDTTSGAVAMVARDYESPVDADGNNRYEITIKATDADDNSTSQAITVSVVDVLESATLDITGLEESYSLDENLTFTSPAPSVSGAIGAVIWTLEGGDADRFSVNPSTGVISMVPRDFEAPADVGADNRYNIVLRATDADGNTAIREVDVQIINVNESSPLAISGVSDASVPENSGFTSTAPSVSDALGSVTWSLTGEDAEHFSIDATTGIYSMVPRDFEAPADADGNNVYRINVRASDTNGNVAEQAVSINVTDVDDAPTLIISGVSSTSQPENAAYTATASVANAVGAVRWSLGGPDAALFEIGESTGMLSMPARDYESPADGGADNTYTVTIVVTDEQGNSASKDIVVSITDEQEVSALSISGLADGLTDENLDWNSVTPEVSGAIGDVTWSLEGADADYFRIEATTGDVRLLARDFENPTDSDGDNVYEVTVRATDADENTVAQPLQVTVENIYEPATLVITGLSNTSVEENQSFNVTPAVSGSQGRVTWRVEGPDADRFTINASTGALDMVARDFEAPVDADENNTYEITVIAEDLDGNLDSESLTINVTNVVEPSAIDIGGLESLYSIDENSVFTTAAPVPNGAIGTVTWSLGGEDAGRFSIDSVTGVVSLPAQNYEAPTDANGDNAFVVFVRARDADNNQATRHFQVSVNDVVEESALNITGIEALSVVNENSPFTSATPTVSGAIGAVTWTLEGSDAERFSVDAASGAISMVARDFEAPADTGADNVYNIALRVTDADGNTAIQEVDVQIVNVNESALLTITGVSDASVAENIPFTSAAPSVSGALGSVTWSLTGADASHFSIDAATGIYSMAARNFEAPADADGDNVYRVNVRASDTNGNVTEQSVGVSINDETELSVITINTEDLYPHPEHAGEEMYVTFENSINTVLSTVSGAIGSVRWSLEGPDASVFSINSSTGSIVLPSLDFENPRDADADNYYELTLRATDADENTGTRTFSVLIRDEDEFATPVISGLSSVTVNENVPFQQTASVSGAIGSVTWSLEGPDAARFTIDASTGELNMAERNYEAPEDANGDNTYEIVVKVTDADSNNSSQAISVTVADVIEPATLVVTGVSSVELNENTPFQQTAAVSGAIGVVSWSLVGADAERFVINASTGVLNMVARDFENPGDFDGDNIYYVGALATDADGNSNYGAFSVTILDDNEAPTAVALNNTTSTLPENSDTTTRVKVADIAITDDALGSNSISLSGADAESFEVIGNELFLKAGTSLDYEAKTSYGVQIAVSDPSLSGSTAVSTTFTLSVSDEPDSLPLQITSSGTQSIDENLAFSTTLAASGGSGAITWSKTGGIDASLFSLSSEGVLTMSAKDAELAEDADSNNTYLVQVQATDELGASTTLDLSLTVANVEDVSTTIPFTSPAFAVDEDATLAFTGADLFARANFSDDIGVTLASLLLSNRSGTLIVDGVTIGTGATATVTSGSALSWKPASNVNGSSILMFNAKATASDGSTSSVVAVNANVAPVPDASTLSISAFYQYDVNPTTPRSQTLLFGSAFDVDGSMTLTVQITSGYSSVDGDTLVISSGVSPTTAVLFATSWEPTTGTLTITPSAGQSPNNAGWSAIMNAIAFSTNDQDVGDTRGLLATLVSGPDLETRTSSTTITFSSSAAGEELGLAFEALEDMTLYGSAEEDVAWGLTSEPLADSGGQDALAWWQLAESFALLR